MGGDAGIHPLLTKAITRTASRWPISTHAISTAPATEPVLEWFTRPGSRRKTKKRKEQVQISELFVEEMCSPAVLDFLRSTGVGKAVPREDGEDEEEDQDGASESGGRIRKM